MAMSDIHLTKDSIGTCWALRLLQDLGYRHAARLRNSSYLRKEGYFSYDAGERVAVDIMTYTGFPKLGVLF